MNIAADRELEGHEDINTSEIRVYIGQVTKMLELFYFATKNLEGDSTSSIADVIPTVLNLILELENPEVSLSVETIPIIALAD
jgi:hypothetical protein